MHLAWGPSCFWAFVYVCRCFAVCVIHALHARMPACQAHAMYIMHIGSSISVYLPSRLSFANTGSQPNLKSEAFVCHQCSGDSVQRPPCSLRDTRPLRSHAACDTYRMHHDCCCTRALPETIKRTSSSSSFGLAALINCKDREVIKGWPFPDLEFYSTLRFLKHSHFLCAIRTGP